MYENDNLQDLLSITIASLSQQRCVLVLGPDIYMSDEIENRVIDRTEFFLKLQKENTGITFFPTDGVMIFQDEDRFKIQQNVRKFYSGDGDVQLLETISKIKFPLIINASPDESLFHYLHKLDNNVQEDYFEGDQDENKNITFNKDQPLIYNVFGKSSDPQSLIISHGLLYRRMQEILPQNSFPNAIRTYLQKANSFLFLGFRFDSWAYQLLTYKIFNEKIIDPNKIRLSSSPQYVKDKMINSIMTKPLGISITDSPPLQILNRLIQIINNTPATDLLRDTGMQDKFSSFISYNRRNKMFLETLVERFKNKVSEMNINENAQTELQLLYDTQDLGYGQSIDSFMTRIGKGKIVIMMISEDYLKSYYCMTEALRVNEHHKFDERVFYILITNDLILDFKNIDVGMQYYYDYWQGKLTETASREGADQERIIGYVLIRDFIKKFIKNISDLNNYVVDVNNIAEELLDDFILQLIIKMKEEL
ncbi:toll/interleukin-1 receptor domain-containing protein [Chryseobacterium candidae]|uniref:TIR domain-containing protein n=1 Tax=Chryseobacterium candidae TaxID=1978493 RepID=A0ABY2R2B1_9FLAO|nr:toll/interleukin-1 receptor domain-containing protein [Chryseobacterium candidae]THV56460.1 TIR domain-containing protein [Chryseobacterium candidae]